MEWFIAVVAVAILGVAAMAAAGGMGEMDTDPVRDVFQQDLPTDRPLDAADIQTLRFGVTLRGYSMSQVDEVLDRLTREIAQRDATIRHLSDDAAGAGGVDDQIVGKARPGGEGELVGEDELAEEDGLVEETGHGPFDVGRPGGEHE